MKLRLEFEIIGLIYTPFETKEGMPIQSCYSNEKGRIGIFPEYSAGLKDLDNFSHVYLIYFFHKAQEKKLTVHPYLDSNPRGIFSTRAPIRPNPIGISIVKLENIDHSKAKLWVEGVDMLNKTPLLDIKPYVPHFDHRDATTGWISKSNYKITDSHISDDRF